MSSNVLSHGYMAILADPVGDSQTEAWEILQERLYDEGNGLQINYEGTILFSDNLSRDSEDIYGMVIENSSRRRFLDVVRKSGLIIKTNSIRWYSCIWYNGTDSDMSDITIEKFNEMIKS